MSFSYIWSPIFRIIDSGGSRPTDKGEGVGGGGGGGGGARRNR